MRRGRVRTGVLGAGVWDSTPVLLGFLAHRRRIAPKWIVVNLKADSG